MRRWFDVLVWVRRGQGASEGLRVRVNKGSGVVRGVVRLGESEHPLDVPSHGDEVPFAVDRAADGDQRRDRRLGASLHVGSAEIAAVGEQGLGCAQRLRQPGQMHQRRHDLLLVVGRCTTSAVTTRFSRLLSHGAALFSLLTQTGSSIVAPCGLTSPQPGD